MRFEKLSSFYHFLFLFYIASFFLMIGADSAGHILFRTRLGIFLFVVYFLFVPVSGKFSRMWNGVLLLFLCFWGYELARALWAFWGVRFQGWVDGQPLPLKRYMASPLLWSFYVGAFILAFSYFKSKTSVTHLIKTMAWTGFFLAINAIPLLMIHGVNKAVYIRENFTSFFYPALYFHEWIPKYLLIMKSHSNLIGDIMAFGFFPALGLFFYGAHVLAERTKSKDRDRSKEGFFDYLPLFLYLLVSLMIAVAILLFISRGTILSFVASFLGYLMAMVLKYPSRKQFFMVLVFLGGVAFSGLVFGKFGDVWKEIQTLGRENDAATSSWSVNQEAARRALRIYYDYPVWGVGTRGYKTVSKKYASLGTEDVYIMANLQSMSHYLQLLSEEGIGAFLYYLLLVAYFLSMTIGLIKTKSRFKFMMGLSLFAPVFSILLHAAISYILYHFSSSMLLYLTMGANLAVLRNDFAHDS